MTDIVITGNLTAAPDLKFGQSGKAWARFTVVANDRTFDKDQNKWVDKNPTFWRCVAFGKDAENLAESADKGTRVIVLGKVYEESYKAQDGTDKREMRVTAEEVGVSLKFGSVKAGGAAAKPQNAPSAEDPWGVPF